jgi:hypothetical protein
MVAMPGHVNLMWFNRGMGTTHSKAQQQQQQQQKQQQQ